MKNKKYNIFISYRGNSKRGKIFAKRLYDAMLQTPGSERIFGNIYYSPAEPIGNFRDDIEKVMKNVDYFIIPFDKDYFKDFYTYGGSLNEDSITRMEIDEAIRINCKFFMPVSLDGTNFDPVELKAIFPEYKRIVCAKRSFYIDEQLEEMQAIDDLVYQVCEAIYMYQRKRKKKGKKTSKTNVHMQFKQEAEATEATLNIIGSRKVTFVNYAGTSFLTGTNVSTNYLKQNWFRHWFLHAVKSGMLSATVVLTDPCSPAAKEAEFYKMRARGLRIPLKDVITTNIESILEFKAMNSQADIRLYLTDVSLPYAINLVEFDDSKKNFAKIDLYSPFLVTDDQRPTFNVDLAKGSREFYHFFKDNADNIIKNAKEVEIEKIEGNWLFSTPIVHRAKINNRCEPMTKYAYMQCIKNHMPIEVDVSLLSDGELFVGRNEKVEFEGKMLLLSEMSKEEFCGYKDSIAEVKGEILLFEEFLAVVNGQIPILFELKYDISEISKEIEMSSKEMARVFVEKIKGYNGEFAVFSSNSYIMNEVKVSELNVLCGQITLDMSTIKGASKEMIEFHENNKFMDVWESNPDFIACRLEDINKKQMMYFCNNKKIPLIGWVVDTEDKKYLGKCCSNIITELSYYDEFNA